MVRDDDGAIAQDQDDETENVDLNGCANLMEEEIGAISLDDK